MELITAITNMNWTEVCIALIVLFVMFSGGAASSANRDDDDEYELATWNPASVNYND